jgi:hypothetical protein
MMAATSDWTSWGLVIGLGILSLTMVRMLRRRTRQMARAETPYRPRLSTGQGAEEKGLRRSMEELLVELQEVNRQINAQLDTKMRAFMQLTEAARQEIERLEALLAATRGAPPADAPDAASPPPVDPRHRRVHDLADAGLSTVDIARQTGQSLGEVELILSLRSTAASTDQPAADRGRSLDMRT